MRKSTRRELNKARELVWHFLEDKVCFFCGQPILNEEQQEILKDLEFGLATAPPIPTEITIHHKDEESNRKRYSNVDQSRKNRDVAHRCCHKRYDAKKNKIWNLRKSVIEKAA